MQVRVDVMSGRLHQNPEEISLFLFGPAYRWNRVTTVSPIGFFTKRRDGTTGEIQQMDDLAVGGGGILAVAILLAVLAPYIMLQLARIWHWAWENNYHLQRIEKHLSNAADERKEATERAAQSLKAMGG
jgi:hypothetical protein